MEVLDKKFCDYGGDIVLLTIQQVADRLQLSKATVRNRIKDGSLKAIKLGYNTLRVEESELEKFIRSLAQ
jgi:excisionase family DNA binding protein